VLPRELLTFVGANRHPANVAQVHFVCYNNTREAAVRSHGLQLCEPLLH
jgi:hypothetical protein